VQLRLDVAVAMESRAGDLSILSRCFGAPAEWMLWQPNAADVSLVVGPSFQVCVPGFMASLAFFIHLLGGSSGGVEDHPGIAGLRVCVAGA